MKPRGISAFSGPSFHLASVVGRSSQVGPIAVEEGNEDGLAHMHLDTLSLSQAAHQSAQTSGHAASFTLSTDTDSAEAEGEGAETADAAPTFLLADGTPGFFAIGEDGGDGDGDGGGDGGDGD